MSRWLKVRTEIPPMCSLHRSTAPNHGRLGECRRSTKCFGGTRIPAENRTSNRLSIPGTLARPSAMPAYLTVRGPRPKCCWPRCCHLIYVQRLRLELPEIRRAIQIADRRDRRLRDHPRRARRRYGGVYQDLRRDGLRHVTGSTATSEPLDYEGGSGRRLNLSKIDRFGKAALHIADQRVLVPTHAAWLERPNEVAAFPNIADKDQVDSMTQLVKLDTAIRLARANKNNSTC